MKYVVNLIIFVVFALIGKAIDRDKERIIKEFVKYEKERESKD